MKDSRTKKTINWIDHYLYNPELKPEVLLRKRWAWTWMVANFLGISTMTIIALFFQVWITIWFPISLILIHLFALIIYPTAKRFDLVINIAYINIIILTFIIMVQIGGLRSSLGFVFIGLNAAMGSVLAGNLRWTVSMFILYGISIIFLGFLDPLLATPDYITREINTLYFVLNAVWVNACILFLTVFYMKDKSRFEKTEIDRIKKLDDAKTRLYTNISHEFRTPLTIIEGIAEQMAKHPEKWKNTGPVKIKKQSQSLLLLVNHMLDISKIEAGSMHLNHIHGDIRKFVRYATSWSFSLAENKGIKVKIKLSKNPVYTDYDPEKLMQVITNLMSNAIKFTPPEGKIKVEVLEGIKQEQKIVKIIVSDTGKGIPPDAVTHIFERFYQVPDENYKTPGTGIGLALTKELIKLMKGEISVRSKIEKGTTFEVILPINKLAKVDEDHGITVVHPSTVQTNMEEDKIENNFEFRTSVSPEKPLLLIVEDNSDVVEYLTTILKNHYIIELASNGKIGLEKAQRIIPDMILSDVMMPQMDGFEMLKQLRDNILTDHIPVVVLTARGDLPSKLTGLEIGADHYLVKPFSERELILKLKNLLDARGKMQQKLGVFPVKSSKMKAQYIKELKFLTRINNLLDEHLPEEHFGIKDICLLLSLSRPQLYRKFMALTNKSIGRYIRSYRLHKAKVMMESNGKNVTEAALETGFINLSHFSTIFREEFGFSPSELTKSRNNTTF